MLEFRRLKVKLYPTIKQKKMLDSHFNAYRFCYNLCLDYKGKMWNDYKISKTGYDMSTELVKLIKDFDWLNKCKVELLPSNNQRTNP